MLGLKVFLPFNKRRIPLPLIRESLRKLLSRDFRLLNEVELMLRYLIGADRPPEKDIEAEKLIHLDIVLNDFVHECKEPILLVNIFLIRLFEVTNNKPNLSDEV